MSGEPGAERTRIKRFYERAAAEAADGAFQVTLDGKPVRTPAKAPLAVPSEKLAEAIAAEWQAQGEWLEPGTMPLTKLANVAIDHVEANREAVIDDIVAHAGSDLICYLAAEPQELAMRQMAQWAPVIDWLTEGLDAPFEVATGITHVTQPAQSLERVRRAIADYDAFSLAAIHAMTTLMGSALLTLAHVAGLFDLPTVWQAAHLDEDWQMARWGEEAEAKARRERAWLEMQAADKLLNCVE